MKSSVGCVGGEKEECVDVREVELVGQLEGEEKERLEQMESHRIQLKLRAGKENSIGYLFEGKHQRK